MPTACCICGCPRYHAGEKRSFFKVPTNPEKFAEWQKAVPGIKLKSWHRVCDQHFDPDCVIKDNIVEFKGKIVAQEKRLKCVLRSDAIPTILSVKKNAGAQELDVNERTEASRNSQSAANRKESNKMVSDSVDNVCNGGSSQLVQNFTVASEDCVIGREVQSIVDLITCLPAIRLPSNLWAGYASEPSAFPMWVSFVEIEHPFPGSINSGDGQDEVYHGSIVRKQVTFDIKLRPAIYFYNLRMNDVYVAKLIGNLHCCSDVEKFLSKIDAIKVCRGWCRKEKYSDIFPRDAVMQMNGVWRHKNCSYITETKETLCHFCIQLRHSVYKQFAKRSRSLQGNGSETEEKENQVEDREMESETEEQEKILNANMQIELS